VLERFYCSRHHLKVNVQYSGIKASVLLVPFCNSSVADRVQFAIGGKYYTVIVQLHY